MYAFAQMLFPTRRRIWSLPLRSLREDFQSDLVIGMGGGSTMDTAKIVAALLGSDQPLSQMYGVDQITGGRAPLILVPTTAGTGSEVTPVSIVTVGDTRKMGVSSPVLYPDLALLDASLTVGLPSKSICGNWYRCDGSCH